MVTVLRDVHHEIPFGWLIALYLYLTGLSAGSFMISTLAYGFGMTKFKGAGRVGVVAAALLLVAAPFALLGEAGQPFKAPWVLFTHINPTSPMSWGVALLVLYPINCIIYGLFMYADKARLTRLFGLIGIPLAVSVHGYTGFILALGKGRALWNTALMPVLFLVSAIVSGLGLMILILVIKDRFFSRERKVNEALIFDLAKLLGWAIVFDLVLVFCDLVVLLISHAEAQEVAELMLIGEMGPIFVGIENLLGKILPLFLVFHPRLRTVPAVTVASALVVVGIFFMRYVVIFAGQMVPLV
jgi:tetrathionate reductase subunit C